MSETEYIETKKQAEKIVSNQTITNSDYHRWNVYSLNYRTSISKMLEFFYIIYITKIFEHFPIFYPSFYDSRGRLYFSGFGLIPQGGKLSKLLLDVCEFDFNRNQFYDNITPLKNPTVEWLVEKQIHDKGKMENSKDFFLSKKFELNPNAYITLDATASGIQIIGALTGNGEILTLTNVLKLPNTDSGKQYIYNTFRKKFLIQLENKDEFTKLVRSYENYLITKTKNSPAFTIANEASELTRKFAGGYSEATLQKYPILKGILSEAKKAVESRNSIEQEKPDFNSDKIFGNINIRRTSKNRIPVPEDILLIILDLLPNLFTRKFVKGLIIRYTYSEGSFARTETITEELLKDSTFLEKLHGKAFLQHHPKIIAFIACKLFENTLYKTFPQLVIFMKAFLFTFDIFTKCNIRTAFRFWWRNFSYKFKI